MFVEAWARRFSGGAREKQNGMSTDAKRAHDLSRSAYAVISLGFLLPKPCLYTGPLVLYTLSWEKQTKRMSARRHTAVLSPLLDARGPLINRKQGKLDWTRRNSLFPWVSSKRPPWRPSPCPALPWHLDHPPLHKLELFDLLHCNNRMAITADEIIARTTCFPIFISFSLPIFLKNKTNRELHKRIKLKDDPEAIFFL